MIVNNTTPQKKMGLFIRKRRKSLGLTQKMLAKYANCGVVYIYLLESGKPTIRLDKLIEVLKILGLGINITESKDVLFIDEGFEK